ncbi:MAG: DUF1178 family protein [Burkholderiaceae bacterium]|nr:DUF1178 family protein [Burkholderiaceae bacterium]
MKVFDLRCENDHPFEGWFTSEADFMTQSERKLIECPLCASRDVRRLPSAARLNLGAQPPARQQEALLPTPQQLHAALLKMAREIAAQTEDVGERFAEEARRIHYKEAPERGIRGVTTAQEAAALREEGIEVMPFPFGALLKEPLH